MTRTGKIVIGIVVLLVILGVLGILNSKKTAQQSSDIISVVYTNTEGVTVPAAFDTTAGSVTFTAPELGAVVLPQAISASGARYANEDESIVLWDKGGNVTIEYNGQVLFTGSVLETQTETNQTDATTTLEDLFAKLTAQPWVWEKTEMNDDSVVTPNKSGDFVITFTNEGRVQGKTDCNSFFGNFELDGSKITFGPLASTLMFCEGAKENVFTKQFGEVDTIFFDDAGNLVLLIKYDSGSIIFSKGQ